MTGVCDSRWYEDDDFWLAMYVALFDPERMAGTPAETERILELTGVQPGATLLDLCCGPGRHALELARRGFRVTGVDRTAAFLDRLRRRARREGLRLQLRCRDMREPLGRDRYDAVINMFSSFGYFEDPEDDRRVLRHVLHALRPGGALLLETEGVEALVRRWKARDWTELPDGSLLLQERQLDPSRCWVDLRWILVRDGQREEFRVGHRLFAASELERLFADVGFSDVEVYGGLDGAPYDERAERLVVLGRKGRAPASASASKACQESHQGGLER